MHSRDVNSPDSRRASLFRAFVGDRRGQDLVEYALLVALVGVAALAAAPFIQAGLSAGYATWNQNIQDQWNPPDPAGS